MPPSPPVAVVGSAIHAPRDRARRSLEEAIYDVAQAALRDAGLAIADIDGICVAANDQLALEVLERSTSVGLAVPDQVAIVGAENCLLAPDAMETPISSVDTNLEALGYRGAELLDRRLAEIPDDDRRAADALGGGE